MAQKIEVDPFIRKDVIEILEDYSEPMRDNVGEDCTGIDSANFEQVMDDLMEKITEFINENYIPKP